MGGGIATIGTAPGMFGTGICAARALIAGPAGCIIGSGDWPPIASSGGAPIGAEPARGHSGPPTGSAWLAIGDDRARGTAGTAGTTGSAWLAIGDDRARGTAGTAGSA
jgi:hypothetical protein